MTIKDAPLLPIASELLSKVFKGMNSKGINFIVLRNYKKLPISWRNDIDILVEPNSLDKAHELILKIFCKSSENITVESLKRYNYRAARCVCLDRTLHIDLISHMTKGWFSYANTEVILKAHKKVHPLFNVPDPTHELLLIVAKELFAYGAIRERYHDRIINVDHDLLYAAADLIFGGYLSAKGQALILKTFYKPTSKGYPGIKPSNLLRFNSALCWARMRPNNWEDVILLNKKNT